VLKSRQGLALKPRRLNSSSATTREKQKLAGKETEIHEVFYTEKQSCVHTD